MNAYDPYRYYIKIRDGTIIIDGKEYPNIIEKHCFYNKAAFKKSFKELSEKYKENQITTYQNIRGRWYECPKPNI
ncbi:hypothetical protein [Fusobacterium polymorphum]|jgi:hypothetical protein|uniref:hypothetical protein n=1 Tax=Fusobacterium nucleatum subsp. polymorphum TaxID=76857 RepID=UPI0030CCB35A